MIKFCFNDRRAMPLMFAALILAGSTSTALAFTFPNAEFVPGDDGMRAAQSFVDNQLKSGLLMNVAIQRVEEARAACTGAEDQTSIICQYLIEARPPDGDLGEDVWTVRLVPGPDGTLQNATVERSHVGMPGYISG